MKVALVIIAVVLFAVGAYHADPNEVKNPVFDLLLGLALWSGSDLAYMLTK